MAMIVCVTLLVKKQEKIKKKSKKFSEGFYKKVLKSLRIFYHI